MQYLLYLAACISLPLSGKADSVSYKTRVEKQYNGIKINSIIIDLKMFNDLGFQPEDCSSDENNFCLKWGDKANFQINKLTENCEQYDWTTSLNETLSVSFALEGAQLYGGPEMNYQTWPIQLSAFPLLDVPYVTHDGEISQSVLERYWLTSKGQYLFVDETVPLFVSQNSTTLTFSALRADPYIREEDQTILKFVFCDLENVKEAHEHAIAHVFEKPRRIPDFRMVQFPIWSTWAAYKHNITEGKALEFADAIVKNGFPNSALEIDDHWETCYGSLTVNKTKFPNMKGLVKTLNDKGFRVTLWIHPFISYNCSPVFEFALDSGFLVENASGSVYMRWWNGIAGAIDFTNPDASKWWVERLQKLKNETGLDSFKFDAGEMSYLPYPAPVYMKMLDDHPDTYIKEYAKAVDQFGSMIEIRTATRIQGISPFVRMIDRETRWTGYRAMDTLIPALLQMNIIGYPFVLPDMIGGNGYRKRVLTEEMYIRWLQINTFMPSLQFSLPPWNISERAVKITKKYIDLHASYAEKIHGLMVKATLDGTPVNLPLWWIDPLDEISHVIGSEFLLGEDILVAPIVEEGTIYRDIYIPKGIWIDGNDLQSSPIRGPTWLRNYKADLDVLPYFLRSQMEIYETKSTTTFIPRILSIALVIALLIWLIPGHIWRYLLVRVFSRILHVFVLI